MADLTGDARARYVRSMFAGIVGRYDLMNAVMTAGLDAAWRRTAVRIVAPTPGGLALDAACGTGALTRELARWPFRRVVGLDFTPSMLEAAARSRSGSPGCPFPVRRRSFRAPIDWVCGDVLALPFGDAIFDCVTIGFGLRNLGDLRRGLAELRRVAKPGGRIACLELTPLRHDLFGRAARLYLRRLVPVLGQLLAGSREAYAYLPASADRFPDARSLAELMRSAGWADVRWRAVGLGMVTIHHAARPHD
jgi:demethylmenaquinone methyltransferase/2-methoxy-6-polyprenyl-1,4-benzoquinol methylase